MKKKLIAITTSCMMAATMIPSFAFAGIDDINDNMSLEDARAQAWADLLIYWGDYGAEAADDYDAAGQAAIAAAREAGKAAMEIATSNEEVKKAAFKAKEEIDAVLSYDEIKADAKEKINTYWGKNSTNLIADGEQDSYYDEATLAKVTAAQKAANDKIGALDNADIGQIETIKKEAMEKIDKIDTVAEHKLTVKAQIDAWYPDGKTAADYDEENTEKLTNIKTTAKEAVDAINLTDNGDAANDDMDAVYDALADEYTTADIVSIAEQALIKAIVDAKAEIAATYPGEITKAEDFAKYPKSQIDARDAIVAEYTAESGSPFEVNVPKTTDDVDKIKDEAIAKIKALKTADELVTAANAFTNKVTKTIGLVHDENYTDKYKLIVEAEAEYLVLLAAIDVDGEAGVGSSPDWEVDESELGADLSKEVLEANAKLEGFRTTFNELRAEDAIKAIEKLAKVENNVASVDETIVDVTNYVEKDDDITAARIIVDEIVIAGDDGTELAKLVTNYAVLTAAEGAATSAKGQVTTFENLVLNKTAGDDFIEIEADKITYEYAIATNQTSGLPKAMKDARTEYGKLSKAQQGQIKDEAKTAYSVRVSVLEALENTKTEFEAMVKALPPIMDGVDTEKEALVAAEKAFVAITDEALITELSEAAEGEYGLVDLLKKEGEYIDSKLAVVNAYVATKLTAEQQADIDEVKADISDFVAFLKASEQLAKDADSDTIDAEVEKYVRKYSGFTDLLDGIEYAEDEALDDAEVLVAGLSAAVADVTAVTPENKGDVQSAVNAYENLAELRELTGAEQKQYNELKALLDEYEAAELQSAIDEATKKMEADLAAAKKEAEAAAKAAEASAKAAAEKAAAEVAAKAIKTVTVAAETTYTGKAVAPAVSVKDASGAVVAADQYEVFYQDNKTIGKATVVVTAKADGKYNSYAKASFVIKPAKAAIKSAKAGKKQVKVTVKEQEGAKYQIAYKVKGSKKFKTVKTTNVTKTIKKLKKGKTYQIKVRAYAKIDGKTYNGAYSKVKNVKVK